MKIETKLYLILLPLLWIGCRNGKNEPNAPAEGTVIARVVAYNEAKLTGDTWRRMRVSFDNSSHSGGRISEGHTATMIVRGIPNGWITNVTLWMRSNKNSGAGEISVIMGDTTIMSLNGTYADWVGNYSDSNKPVSTSRQAWEYAGEDIVLTIVGTTNSLYLDRMEISYSDHQPVFPPKEPDTTFIQLIQDTTFVSGDYALVCDLNGQYVVAKGGWINGKYLEMDSVSVTENEEGLAVWQTNNWPEKMRYRLTFDEDSVSIFLPSEKEYIGHNATTASKKDSRWAWKKAADGSLYIHHGMSHHEGPDEWMNYWQAYSFYPWIVDNQTVAKHMYIIWDENTTYWKLMKVKK